MSILKYLEIKEEAFINKLKYFKILLTDPNY